MAIFCLNLKLFKNLNNFSPKAQMVKLWPLSLKNSFGNLQRLHNEQL